MFKTRSIAIVAVIAFLIAGGAGTYGIVKKNEAKYTFLDDGYLMDGAEELEGGYAKYTFYEGSKFLYHYPDKVVFVDSTNTEVVAEAASFLHYADGSVSALAQGVLTDLNGVSSDTMAYYNLASNVVLTAQGDSYTLESQDGSMFLQNFLWKIGENHYLLVSDDISITLADSQEMLYSDYVELKYYNEGILLILSEEGAYRTVSNACVATIENGVRIDLASRTILAGDEVCMSMEQMVIGADDNIDILTPIRAAYGEEKKEKQVEILVPTFEVIDGADGINGEAGTDGLAGEDGTNGKKGTTGEEGAYGANGIDGIAGANGLFGENGIDGELGESGAPGTPGQSGTSGLSGAGGAAGQSGLAGANGIAGNDGLDGDVVIEGGSSGAYEEDLQLPVFTLQNASYTQNTATFSISYEEGNVRLAGTNDIIIKIIQTATGREVRREGYSSQDESLPLEVTIDELLANTEYRLVLNAQYIVGNSSYEKSFLSRSFTTSSLGVSFTKYYLTDDTLAFVVTKASYSDVESMDLVLANLAGTEIVREPVIFDPAGTALVVFESSAGLITSNTDYQVFMNVFDGSNYFNGLGTQEYRTLKKSPELGIAEAIVNKADSVFDMQLSSVKDEDGGILYYSYELYLCDAYGEPLTQNGPEKTLLTSTNKVVACEVTEAMRMQTYQVRVVASFFDNEKTVEYASSFSNPFSMISTGYPLVTYTAITEAENGGAVTKHDRLVGTLQIATNNTSILIDAQHPLLIEYQSGAGYTNRMTVTTADRYTFVGANGNGTFSIPVDWSNLRANDNYIISVWAYTDIGDETNTYSNLRIGTVVANTPAPAGFSSTITKESGYSIGFSLSLNDVPTGETAGYEASTIDRLELRLYNGDKTSNATAPVVASTVLTADAGTAAQRNSSLGAGMYGQTNAILVTERDFSNFSASQITGDTYTVEIVAVQDYTDYRNTFAIENTTKVLTKEAAPPTWDESFATNGFVITKIYNNQTSLKSVGMESMLDASLPSDTVMGVKVTSKYDNSANLATRFEYYAYSYTDASYSLTDAAVFYGTTAYVKKIEITPAAYEVPSAVFMFGEGENELSRGHHYFFSGRVEIGSQGKYFPDGYAANETPVMKSQKLDFPYLTPEFSFAQYDSDGTGTLVYYYWIKAGDRAAVSTDFTVTGATLAERTVTMSKNGNTQGTLTLTGISANANVVVSVGKRSYEEDGFTWQQVVKQVYEKTAGFADIIYTVENKNDENRLLFRFAPMAGCSAEPLSRLTAVKVTLWKRDDTTTKKEFTIQLSYVGDDTATAYLNYSSIAELVGNTLTGEVIAIYDTKESGFKLAEGSGTAQLAIKVVRETASAASRYVTLNADHSGAGLSDTTTAWDSLFTVTKRASVAQKNLSLSYTSPLDKNFAANTLTLAATTRGMFLDGTGAVVTLGKLEEKKLTNTTSSNGQFEVNVTGMTPSVNPWLGNKYNIVTEPNAATIKYSVEGHASLLGSTPSQIKENKMYLELYEVIDGAMSRLIYTAEDTAGAGASYTPSVLTATENSYEIKVEGLTTGKTYAVHFYYITPAGEKVYPLDYYNSDKSLYYTFVTLDSVQLDLLSTVVALDAATYQNKQLVFRFLPSTTFGFQVKYDLVKKEPNGTYTDILTSSELAALGIVTNTVVIGSPTEVRLNWAPGSIYWNEGGVTKYFVYGLEDYFLRVTPVSTVDEMEEVGPAQYISMELSTPSTPFFNVVATPGADTVTFKIAVADMGRVIADDTYTVIATKIDSSGNRTAATVNKSLTGIATTTPLTFTVSGLGGTDTVEIKLYAVTDIKNDGIYEALDTNNVTHCLKTVVAAPLGDKTYDLGTMSVLSAGGGRANLYFTNAVGLEDTTACSIRRIIYSVTRTDTNGTTTSATYTDAFTIHNENAGMDVKYIELKPAFESGAWYTIYIKFLDEAGAMEQEATFSYKG